eukprot:COSAG06_NODE_16_length_34949_cov_31.500832_6_plen_1279_part_00
MKLTGVLALTATAGLAHVAHANYECNLDFRLTNAALKPGCTGGDASYCEVQCDAGYDPTTPWDVDGHHNAYWCHCVAPAAPGDCTWSSGQQHDLGCQKIQCATASVTGHAQQCSSGHYEQPCHVGCDAGYTGSGRGQYTCAASGHWEGGNLMCAPTQNFCSHDPPGANVEFFGNCDQGKRTIDGVCNARCKDGFERLGGDAVYRCGADGQWKAEEQPLQCEKRCPARSPAQHSIFPQSCERIPGASACEASCDSGYAGAGDATYTCGGDARWSGGGLECTLSGCGDGLAPVTPHGQACPSADLNSTCSAACVPGYTASGAAEYTCTRVVPGQPAQWVGGNLTCVVIPDWCSGAPTAESRVEIISNDCAQTAGSKCEAKCAAGSFAVQGLAEYICRGDEHGLPQWAPARDEDPLVCERDCPVDSAPLHAQFSRGCAGLPRRSCIAECIPPFIQVAGTKEYKCLDGEWQDAGLVCKLPCQAGSEPTEYNETTFSTHCAPCDDGRFSSDGLECKECREADTNRTKCLRCPDGLGPNPKGTACEVCREDLNLRSKDGVCESKSLLRPYQDWVQEIWDNSSDGLRVVEVIGVVLATVLLLGLCSRGCRLCWRERRGPEDPLSALVGSTEEPSTLSTWSKEICWATYMLGAITLAFCLGPGWQHDATTLNLAAAMLTIGTAVPVCWVVPNLKQQLEDSVPLSNAPAPTGAFGLSMCILGCVGAMLHVCFCISLLECRQIGLFVCAVSTSVLTMATTAYFTLSARSKIFEHDDAADWYRTDSHSKQAVLIMIVASIRIDALALLRLRISNKYLVDCPMKPEHFQWIRYVGIYHCLVEDLSYVLIAGLKLAAGCADGASSVPQSSFMSSVRYYAEATAVLRIALSSFLIVVNLCDKSGQWLAHRSKQRGVHLQEGLLQGEESAQETLVRQNVASYIQAAEGDVFCNQHISMLCPGAWRNQEVGNGAFGIVYKATWGSREVAVKEIILPREPHNPTAAARRLLQDNVRKIKADFVKEVEISGKHSHHPNLVRLLGWADDPNLCLVQEFLHGQSLHSQLYVEGWQPTPGDVLKVALDVANGMTHLHDEFDTPIIHRDLKSANLMLTTPPADPSYTVKITDFGLTRESHIESTMTASTVGHGGAAGTVLWMAPELVLGDDSYDEKVDVFSYAMCLIELVNQEKPWQGSRVRQEAISHLVQSKRPTHQLRRADPQLQLLITDCWNGDASSRPPFREITARLEAMLRDGGGETARTQAPELAAAGGAYPGVSRPISPTLSAVPELLDSASE